MTSVRGCWWLVTLVGCSWRAGYDDAALACQPPLRACPIGYRCSEQGACLRLNDGVPDAGEPLDGGDDRITLTFSERPGSDVTDVTFDTYLSSGNPTDNKGAKDVFYCTTADPRHALVRFDLSAIPATASIASAHLELWTTEYAAGGAVRAYPVLEAWDEGNQDDAGGVANWSFRRPLVRWSSPGAAPPSRDDEPVAEMFASASQTSFTMPLPADLVQAWVDDPDRNFGLAILAVSSVGDFGFVSSEAPEARRRPQLTVEILPWF